MSVVVISFTFVLFSFLTFSQKNKKFQDLSTLNMESVRHTGATVLGLSVVDRQLIEEKKASGEISKVSLFVISSKLC